AAAVIGQLAYWMGYLFKLPSGDRDLVNQLIFYAPQFGLPAFAGWARRRRRKLTAKLEARVAEVRRERELLAAQAVARERLRIADELRALVIQGVDRMTSWGVRAKKVLEHRPDPAPAEIGAIEATGRRTLVEMRRLLGVLRRSNQAADVPL